MEKFPTPEPSEKSTQQEFFSTEAGTVAGRENMERLSQRVESMLSEGDLTITEIKKKLEEARKQISSKEENSGNSDQVLREYAFQNPDRDPKKQSEYVTFLNRSARERSEKAAAEITKIADLSQRLEQGAFSFEDARAAMNYLSIPNAEERMATQIFLARADQAKREEGER